MAPLIEFLGDIFWYLELGSYCVVFPNTVCDEGFTHKSTILQYFVFRDFCNLVCDRENNSKKQVKIFFCN